VEIEAEGVTAKTRVSRGTGGRGFKTDRRPTTEEICLKSSQLHEVIHHNETRARTQSTRNLLRDFPQLKRCYILRPSR